VANEIEVDANGGNAGGDSDEEGDECILHSEAIIPQSRTEEEGDVDYSVNDRGDFKGLVQLTDTGTTNVIGSVILGEDGSKTIDVEFGDGTGPKEVNIARPPDDWEIPEVQDKRGEPKFEDVDNPGNWPRYCYRPEFASRAKTSKYKRFSLPTGAEPVPKNIEGERKLGEWTFHYNGWSNPDKPYRHGATNTNMFPKEMNGCLDANVLKKLGLTKKGMTKCDALFFYQLILPLCDPSQSGIDNDPRRPYYFEVERFTNMSKCESGSGGSYGHKWESTTAKELANLDGILVMDSVLGSTRVMGHCIDDGISTGAATMRRLQQQCLSRDSVRSNEH
jgi:hypothetical protein